ncbi:hypothetical protein [Paludisphaera mucosa]|uniref:Phage terminase large subunit N-terminal domain-containing protein n=1 Tax=Paludisphaera mucosa TaxID=3030827 RepID=A0ABT6FD66_9BACT|nr:hypothetical protein [Paludisphaera mucosa]MDG3005511.1 hypothetical protein [Paludisphaera mucosa]
MFAAQVLDRPSLALWHGPRGSGKSYLSALDTHLASRFHPRHESHVLGGSRAQSEQIYRALQAIVFEGAGIFGGDRGSVRRLLKTEGVYTNGSRVSILAASPTSVRGPHVASLKLDEVDEIDPEIREAAIGMAMDLRGVKASVLMTSTWHRPSGPMAGLIDQAKAGAFPISTYCIFEVLERCPTERSGRRLEKCPQCPLMPWCHEGRDDDPKGRPKAKRSEGHYGIDALIQKVKGVSPRVFASDYLCRGPKTDGVWFKEFDAEENVTESAEFDPSMPVHVAIDSGVFTGAVLFQVVRGCEWAATSEPTRVHVFADFLSEGRSADACALEIRAMLDRLCGSAARYVSTDSAGGARNPVGPTVVSEYQRCGLVGESGLQTWPKYPGCVLEGLSVIESLVRSADGSARLKLHPRCTRLTAAFLGYARARRSGQWMDYPADPQHPWEDLIDALRGGLSVALPEGTLPAAAPLRRARADRVF